jgi:hypothetical protein
MSKVTYPTNPEKNPGNAVGYPIHRQSPQPEPIKGVLELTRKATMWDHFYHSLMGKPVL